MDELRQRITILDLIHKEKYILENMSKKNLPKITICASNEKEKKRKEKSNGYFLFMHYITCLLHAWVELGGREAGG
jgi:hypothetical protein